MATGESRRRQVLFLEIRDLQPERRQTTLNDACGPDHDLRFEVEALLAAEDENRWLHAPPIPTAAPPQHRSPAAAPEPRLDHAPQSRSDNESSIELGSQSEKWDGVHLGDYRLVQREVETSWYSVYTARTTNSERLYRIELFNANALSDEEIARFPHALHELSTWAQPGFARLVEAKVLVVGGQSLAYMVREPSTGTLWLDDAVTQQWDTREKMRSLARIADILHGAHQKGFTHRGLTPDSIRIDDEGSIHVEGLGFAQATDADLRYPGSRMTRERLRRLAFLSPEQLRGDRECIDIRSDVYALGLLGYSLLYGIEDIDIEAQSLGEAMTALSTRPWPQGDDARLDEILARCTASDPAARYQSAHDIATAIDDWAFPRATSTGLSVVDDDLKLPLVLTQGEKKPHPSSRYRTAIGSIIGIALGVFLGWMAATEFAPQDVAHAKSRTDANSIFPLEGLAPLGVDERSGAWQFWATDSGVAPQRDPEGHWTTSEEDGIVFTLISTSPEGEAIVPILVALEPPAPEQWSRLIGEGLTDGERPDEELLQRYGLRWTTEQEARSVQPMMEEGSETPLLVWSRKRD